MLNQTHTADSLPHLNGRCILYVGGRDKIRAHLRDLVEQCGGRFLHHDGGLDSSAKHLDQVLCQADTIFCPLSCISHGACKKIKQFCKKHDKTMIFLKQESVAAFRRGLQGDTRFEVF